MVLLGGAAVWLLSGYCVALLGGATGWRHNMALLAGATGRRY